MAQTFDPLTPDQIAAIRRYAGAHGRTWKSKLQDDWFHARTSGEMQTLRNTHGPSWLVSFRLLFSQQQGV